MSAEEQARFTIQTLLARGLGATEVARRTTLARASEVWGGDEPLDRPAWYVWLSGTPGAYKLDLAEAGVLPAGGWRARFTIRYYPSPAEPVFPGFSAEERDVVRSGLLDVTGTPRIDAASTIPHALFGVGSMEWGVDAARDATFVGLSALDRVVAREGDGRVARDVPGWRLGAGLVSTFAGLHAQIERQAVRRILLSRQPGFELLVGGTEPTWRDTEDAIQADAALLFAAPGQHSTTGDSLLEALRDPDGEVVADERFDGRCRHPVALGADPRIPLHVSHAWFGGESLSEDRIACSC
jgi:hypothetical protein